MELRAALAQERIASQIEAAKDGADAAGAEPSTLRFATIFGDDAPMFVRWPAGERLVLVSQTLPIDLSSGQPAGQAPEPGAGLGAGLGAGPGAGLSPPIAEALNAALSTINRRLDMVGLLAEPARGAVWLRTHLFADAQGRLDYPLFLTVVAACVRVVYDCLAELCAALGREPPVLPAVRSGAGPSPGGVAAEGEQAQALLSALSSFSE